MDARLIAVASPVFFVLVFVEWWLLRRRAEPVYRLHDSIADLSCGVGEQVCQVFTYVLELWLYTTIYTHFRFHTFSISSVGAWVALVLLLDVAYYWFHRASHRVNFLWAVHSVHHQSEEYNFTVALRQGWIEPLMIAPFHIPLALMGFPPEMFFVGFTAHTLWQFWPHTRGIGPLGIDAYLNSPANHRCHHAVNPEYIDKNYSGMLIVWDRLFGTWAREKDEPVFGTVKPLASFNPLWAQLSFWTEMAALSSRCTRLVDKFSVPFRPPEWRPAELGGPVVIPAVSPATRPRYEAKAPRALVRYTLFTFALVVLALPALTQAPPTLGWGAKLGIGIFAIASLVTISGLVENKRWARPIEIARLLAFVPVVWLLVAQNLKLAPYLTISLGVAAAITLVQAGWFWSASRAPAA